eukprot:CAMPEP_0180686568 /NCGR_PEP_ID=MMETSP1037_2-20121125/72994_1 /TAXON_ID=632150 /ORGANISM="Azadinium spinosum, Strain 3D9" /LENGTH=207 /DNA_ID=CAMNT_0022717305 /DNA_START=1 /DNA_END=622 /DNA_ORIENTATION=-
MEALRNRLSRQPAGDSGGKGKRGKAVSVSAADATAEALTTSAAVPSAEQAEQADQAEQLADQAEQAEQASQAERARQAEQGQQAKQEEQAKQAAQAEESDEAAESEDDVDLEALGIRREQIEASARASAALADILREKQPGKAALPRRRQNMSTGTFAEMQRMKREESWQNSESWRKGTKQEQWAMPQNRPAEEAPVVAAAEAWRRA